MCGEDSNVIWRKVVNKMVIAEETEGGGGEYIKMSLWSRQGIYEV